MTDINQGNLGARLLRRPAVLLDCPACLTDVSGCDQREPGAFARVSERSSGRSHHRLNRRAEE